MNDDEQKSSSAYGQLLHVLPSGLTVPLLKADPRRPWECSGTGDGCVVRRQRRGDSSQFEFFRGSRLAPLMLNEEDAKALVDRLNSNIGLRLPTTPTRWR